MRWKLALNLAATLLVAVAGAASGATDPQWESFWKEFKQAIEKNDRQAVASMTKLPYLFDSKQLDRKQFVAKYDTIFPKSARQSILKEKPTRDANCYEVFSGEQIYLFAKVKGKYMFTEIGVND